MLKNITAFCRQYQVVVYSFLAALFYAVIYYKCVGQKPYWDDSTYAQAHGVYHITSILLHLINVCLLFWLISNVVEKKVAWVVCVLFLLHPMNYYAISWIVQIKTILSVFFFLIFLVFFQNKKFLRLKKYAFVIGLLAVSFFSYQNTHNYVGEKQAQHFEKMNLKYDSSIGGHLMRYAVTAGIYAAKVVWPRTPQFFPVPEVSESAGSLKMKVFYIAVFLSTLGLCIYLVYKKEMIFAFSFLIYFILSFPFSQTIHIPFYRLTDHAEYWLYPFLTFFLTGLIGFISKVLRPRVFAVFSVALILNCSLAGFQASLKEGALADIIIGAHDYKQDGAWPVYEIYGHELYKKTKYSECLAVYSKLLDKFPNNKRIIEMTGSCLYHSVGLDIFPR